MPTLANIHANAPSTTSNCAQCHGAAAASFAIPAAGFSIVGLPGNHMPTSGVVRDLPRRRGLEHRGDAGGQRREVQRLEDEPRGHHQQLRGLPRPGDQRLDASSA